MSLYRRQKKEVLEACLWLAAQGYFGSKLGSGGNVSVRLEEGLMAITPSSVCYQEMSEEDICVTGFDGSPVTVKKGRKPSIEAAMHGAIYQKRPDVKAVVHTHQTYASVFAALNMSIPALFDEVSWTLGPSIEVIPYALSGSAKLADNVASRLSNHAGAFIMQNHGSLALGNSLKQAMLYAELLEKVAHIYWMALATGKPVSTLPAEAIDYATMIRNNNLPIK